MLAAKVTPAALITCKSIGAKKYALLVSGSAIVLANNSSIEPTRLPSISDKAFKGSALSSNSEIV
ncbi:Uncharacterised protein [Acinetobacter baumannii]|nr:Uncharacterised protein [Acinetobacter baumannii]